MGVLSINQRSARLTNFGDVRMANTNDGSLEAANRMADASRRLNQAHIAAIQSKGRLRYQKGDLISGIGKLINMGVDLKKAYDDEMEQRNLDKYANKFQSGMQRYNLGDDYTDKFQQGMQAHNQGDGKQSLGAMNATIPESDNGKWMESNQEAARRIHESVLKEMGLTEKDFENSRMQKWRDNFMLKQNAQWLQKRNATMSAYEDKEAEAKYANDRNNVTDDIVSPDGWKNISDSMERLIARKGWGPEQAAAFRRKEGEMICGIGIKRAIDATTSEAVALGAEGGAKFDELIKSWDNLNEDSFLPAASNIEVEDENGKMVKRNPLKEWLTGADMKALRKSAIKDAKAARDGWLSGMIKYTKEGFTNGQTDILAIPAPEENDELAQKAYQREVANAYRRLIAKDPNVLDGQGDAWIRNDLKKFAPDKLQIALRAIKGADDKADKARVRANGQIFLQSLILGVPDETVPGGRRLLTMTEKNNMAEYLFSNGEITFADFAKAKKQVGAAMSPLAQDFLNMISQGMNAKFPQVCAWQENLMSYAFKNTQEAQVIANKETGFEASYKDDHNVDQLEQLLYKQYADMASIVLQDMLVQGQKPGESQADVLNRAKEKFDSLVKGTNEGIGKLSFTRRQEAYRKNTELLANTYRDRLKVGDLLPRGFELSRRTADKQKPLFYFTEEDK